MKKSLWVILFIVLSISSALFGVHVTRGKELAIQESTNNVLSVIVSPNPSPSQIVAPIKEIGIPTQLHIPTLKIDTAIESVGLDNQQRMDVPKLAQNVGWYNLGSKVGEKGKAVLAGHFDLKDGSPAVFYHLSDIKIGDEMTVKTDKNEQFVFRVTDKKLFNDATFPIAEVFGSSEKVQLNLITCNGIFDIATKNYSKRLVVFSELVD